MLKPDTWTTATASNGGNCLSAKWHISTYSGGNGCLTARWHTPCGGGECIEARQPHNGFVQVRDSKDPQSPILQFAPERWKEFLTAIRTGRIHR
jgi:hypothetical protein